MWRHLASLTCAAGLFLGSAVGNAAFAAHHASAKSRAAAHVLEDAHYKIDMIGARSPMHGLQGIAMGPDGALYAASLTGHAVYRIDAASGAITTFLAPPRGAADDLAFAADGTVVWTAYQQGFVYARGKDGKVRTLAQNMPGVNAIAFTRSGRLFVSRVAEGDGLYELDPAGVKPPRTVAENIGGLNAFQIAADDSLYGPIMASGKVVKMNIETGKMQDVASGFALPCAVKIEADGHLLVLDYRKGEVVRVDPENGAKTSLGSLPPVTDNLAVGKDGTIYVTSTAYNGVTAIDPKTHAQRRVTWGLLSAPGLLTIVPGDDHEDALVADAWGPRLVNVATGEPALIKSEQLVLGASAIAVNGSTYIISLIGLEGTGSVQVLERATGKLLANFTNFGAPYDVKPVSDGFVVADFAVGRLTKVGNDPAHTRTTYAWDFDGPVGLADAGGGQMYVSEYSGGRISRVDTKTNAQIIVADDLDAPEGIALAPDGHLIVAEVGKQRVLSIDPKNGRAVVLADHLAIGVVAPPQAPAPFLPTGVAVGSDGAVYVTSDIDNVIYRLTPPKS